MYQTIPSVEPFFAPLSRPMLLQALELEIKAPQTEDSSLEITLSPYTRLLTRMRNHREKTYDLLTPVIQQGQFDTDYLLQQLTLFTPTHTTRPVSRESLSRWRDNGLVHYLDRGQPDLDSGAALITLRRMIQHRERGWLPSPPKHAENHYFASEPLWFCWRQDRIDAPIVKCAMPLEPDIPDSTLLWTDWRGASWRPEWLHLGELGCCRWAGTIEKSNTLLWNVSEQDLVEKWNIPISSAYQRALAATPFTLHSLATSALLLLATERLEEMATFALDELSSVG